MWVKNPSPSYGVCQIDLPPSVDRVAVCLKTNRCPMGVEIFRRLENANGSIPSYTVRREDRANGCT